jgi:hypothetical protein
VQKSSSAHAFGQLGGLAGKLPVQKLFELGSLCQLIQATPEFWTLCPAETMAHFGQFQLLRSWIRSVILV